MVCMFCPSSISGHQRPLNVSCDYVRNHFTELQTSSEPPLISDLLQLEAHCSVSVACQCMLIIVVQIHTLLVLNNSTLLATVPIGFALHLQECQCSSTSIYLCLHDIKCLGWKQFVFFLQRCTFLSAHLKRLIRFASLHFSLCNASVWRWPNAVVSGALFECLFITSIDWLFQLIPSLWCVAL